MIFTGYSHFLIIKSEDEKEYELMIPNDLYRQIKNELQEKKDSFLYATCRHGKNYDLIAIKCKIK